MTFKESSELLLIFCTLKSLLVANVYIDKLLLADVFIINEVFFFWDDYDLGSALKKLLLLFLDKLLILFLCYK